MLRIECKLGVGSQNAWKYFTSKERGENKFMNDKCKVFWDGVICRGRHQMRQLIVSVLSFRGEGYRHNKIDVIGEKLTKESE